MGLNDDLDAPIVWRVKWRSLGLVRKRRASVYPARVRGNSLEN
jgi:hypothetical protein